MTRELEYTVAGLLDRIAGRFPDNEALVYVERGLRYTYSEFNQLCRQVAKGLLKLGIGKGDHVSIWAYNVPEWVVPQFATARIGAVLREMAIRELSLEEGEILDAHYADQRA